MMDELAVARRRPNFAAVPYELVDDENISPQAKTVYMALDRHADYKTGATFVGKESIAKKCMLKKANSVDRYLKELRDAGWISWRRRWRKDTGTVNGAGRKVYEYSYRPGEKFEPTTNLYIVNDRVGDIELSGEGIPPTADIGMSATGDTGVSAAADEPMSATRGTNENQGNENQGKGVAVGDSRLAAAGDPSPSFDSSDSHRGDSPSDWCTPDDPRCLEHAGLPRHEVPQCRGCQAVREWFEEQQAEVADRERQRAAHCGFCGGSGSVRVRNGRGQMVDVRCDHVSAPVDAVPVEGHRVVSSAEVRARAKAAIRKAS